jgi:hypothetical protein
LSNPDQKLAAAESRWEAAQLQAANAQRELDYAIAVVENGKSELNDDQIKALDAQIQLQKDSIKDFLMKSHQVYQDAVKGYTYAKGKNA